MIKSKLAFSLYQNFDFDKIVDVDFLYFLEPCKKENLSEYILKMEEQENISNETTQEEIGNFVKKQLDVLYSKFNAVKSHQ